MPTRCIRPRRAACRTVRTGSLTVRGADRRLPCTLSTRRRRSGTYRRSRWSARTALVERARRRVVRRKLVRSARPRRRRAPGARRSPVAPRHLERECEPLTEAVQRHPPHPRRRRTASTSSAISGVVVARREIEPAAGDGRRTPPPGGASRHAWPARRCSPSRAGPRCARTPCWARAPVPRWSSSTTSPTAAGPRGMEGLASRRLDPEAPGRPPGGRRARAAGALRARRRT
jgi:hypothetical protein